MEKINITFTKNATGVSEIATLGLDTSTLTTTSR